MAARLLDFARRLRAARVPVSMVEVLDAIRCLGHVDLADRAQFRAALAASMVKRSADRAPFDVLFEVCFPTLPRAAQPNGGARADGADGGGAGDGPGEVPHRTGPGQDRERKAPGSELLAALLDALRHGDESALRALAGLAVDRFAGVEAQPAASERYYIYRVMRQLELYRLVELAMAQAREGGAEEPDRERLSDQVDAFRRLLAEQVRRRIAAGDGLDHAAESHAELYAERRGDEVDFLRANTTQRRELRAAVRPLARKLAARVAARRRRRRRGRLDVRRTVRRSLSSGGVPADPAFRAPRASKPDLWVLADVSGSVVEFAEFTLSLLHAMHAELARMRAFAFVDGIDEVTNLLDDGAGRLDLRSTFARAKVVDADGHSDYGAVFGRFLDHFAADLGPRSTVLVMGDGRGNYRDPGLPALRALRARARRLYWLNPEPRPEWDTFDSVMSLYAPACDRVFEVRNLRQLSECVVEIT